MMTKDEIFKLIDAGYTKEEIQALDDIKSPDPEPAAEAPAGDERAEQPAAQPAAEKQTAAPVNSNDQILEALNKLTNVMIGRNINQTVSETLQDRKPEDILAEIIAPPRPTK